MWLTVWRKMGGGWEELLFLIFKISQPILRIVRCSFWHSKDLTRRVLKIQVHQICRAPMCQTHRVFKIPVHQTHRTPMCQLSMLVVTMENLKLGLRKTNYNITTTQKQLTNFFVGCFCVNLLFNTYRYKIITIIKCNGGLVWKNKFFTLMLQSLTPLRFPHYIRKLNSANKNLFHSYNLI